MVFTTLANLFRSAQPKGADRFWRKRRILKMSAHFTGRKRNCYSLAIRYTHRALTYATQHRKLKKENIKELWDTRLVGACQEHGFSSALLLDSLYRQNILLNRKTLSNLAIWEPRTFKSIVSLAWCTAVQEKIKGVQQLGPPPQNVSVPKVEDN